MDLGLSETQQMLKSSAREFLAQECPLTLVRAMEEDEKGYSPQLWQQMVDLGWTGLAFPEEYGGTGGGGTSWIWRYCLRRWVGPWYRVPSSPPLCWEASPSWMRETTPRGRTYLA